MVEAVRKVARYLSSQASQLFGFFLSDKFNHSSRQLATAKRYLKADISRRPQRAKSFPRLFFILETSPHNLAR